MKIEHARYVGDPEYYEEIYYSNGKQNWPGFDIPLKRGYWVGNEQFHFWAEPQPVTDQDALDK